MKDQRKKTMLGKKYSKYNITYGNIAKYYDRIDTTYKTQ